MSHMHLCTSTLIRAYGYAPKAQELDLEFVRGGVYRYAAVPGEIFEQFVQAHSKGKFFLAAIKGKFEYTKL